MIITNRLVQTKIVYYGPAKSGKTSSLKVLFNHYNEEKRKRDCQIEVSDLLSIETSHIQDKRTLFFDYGNFIYNSEHFCLKNHIYSATGQDFYIETRPITLSGVDGIVFVVDSQKSAYTRNLISWKELDLCLGEELITKPKIIAFNKQDASSQFDPDTFLEAINYKKYKNLEIYYTIAITTKEVMPEGIVPAYRTILRLVLEHAPLLKSFSIKTLKKEAEI